MKRRTFLKGLFGGAAAVVVAPVIAKVALPKEDVTIDLNKHNPQWIGEGKIIFGDGSPGSPGTIVYTHAKDRMVMHSSGNVGIGTATPESKLHIKTNGMELKFA